MAPPSPDALDRYLFRKSGMDYGPFSIEGMKEQIRLHNVEAGTEIRSVRKGTWRKLAEYSVFKTYLEEWARQEVHERKKQEVLKQADHMERRIRHGGRVPYLLIALLVVGAGTTAYLIARPTQPNATGYPVSFYRDLSFQQLGVLTPVPKAPDDPTKPKAPPRPRRVARAGPGSTGLAAEDFAPVDISLDDDDSGGREITQAELDQVQRFASPRLIECFRAEAVRNPEFRGGTATVYIKTNGDVVLSRISTVPPSTGELNGCCRGAMKGAPHLQPFSPPNKVMEIPIHVSATK